MNKELTDRLLRYIIAKHPLTDVQLMEVATKAGYAPHEVYAALESVGKNKRIKTSVKGDNVVYTLVVARPAKKTDSHLIWARENYPTPENSDCPWIWDENGKMIDPFPEWDLSWMVLSPDEMKEYKMQMKGGYGSVVKSGYGKK